jgi:hypothetical protein
MYRCVTHVKRERERERERETGTSVPNELMSLCLLTLALRPCLYVVIMVPV